MVLCEVFPNVSATCYKDGLGEGGVDLAVLALAIASEIRVEYNTDLELHRLRIDSAYNTGRG